MSDRCWTVIVIFILVAALSLLGLYLELRREGRAAGHHTGELVSPVWHVPKEGVVRCV